MISILVEEIDFEPSSPRLFRPSQGGSGDVLSETDLHYTVLRSYVTMAIADVVFIGPRRRVPLFDFLASVARLVTAVRTERPYVLKYTEAADIVEFRPIGGRRVEVAVIDPFRRDSNGAEIPITPDCLARVDLDELLQVLTEFLTNSRRHLFDNVPGLDRNAYVGKLFVPE